jgi:type VI secretion system secreted protein VgrG
VQLASLRASQKVGEGTSGCTRFSSGHRFTLAEHAVEAFNVEYLLTRIEHWGRGALEGDQEADKMDFYANRFEVIPSTVVFRPARVTRRPRIDGVQTAIVVGPAGEEIHTDEHGRVKVQFHWDRLGKKDDKSSCWMRVSQLWAGEGWGAMWIPRIKQEVVVAFEEGDPDRPMIVGRVYHGANVPPYPLPANKTRSTIKSNSSAGGEGFNEIRFEDKKGSEEIYIHGQKDETIVIENDKNQTIGHDETLHVKNDRTKTVDHDHKETIGHDSTLEVKNDRKETIKHDDTLLVENNRAVTVKVDHTEKVEGKQTVTVTKDQATKVDANQTLDVAKNQTVTVGGDASLTITGAQTIKIDKDHTETITGDSSEKIDKGMTVKVAKDYSLAAANITEKSDAKHVIDAGDQVQIKCGQATITVKSDGSVAIAGAKLSISCSSGDAKIEAVNVEVAAKGTAKIQANGPVTIKGNATMEVGAAAKLDLKGAMIGIG